MSLPIYQLRQVLAALTDTMTADMFTRDVVMKLRIPEMAIFNAKTAIPDLCLQQKLGVPNLTLTHNLYASAGAISDEAIGVHA